CHLDRQLRSKFFESPGGLPRWEHWEHRPGKLAPFPPAADPPTGESQPGQPWSPVLDQCARDILWPGWLFPGRDPSEPDQAREPPVHPWPPDRSLPFRELGRRYHLVFECAPWSLGGRLRTAYVSANSPAEPAFRWQSWRP